jgi:hypothetical protein
MTRAEKLRSYRWTVLANLHNCAFVVETSQGDREVLYFYRDGLSDVPMVNGYFADSFSDDFRNELYESPHKFLKTFYSYCTSNIPDWSLKEELFFQTIGAFNAAFHKIKGGELNDKVF